MAINWTVFDHKLYDFVIETIDRFTKEHPCETICYFSFDTDPKYGYVFIGLDSHSKNLETIKQRERFAVEQREMMLRDPTSWQIAKDQLSSPTLGAYNENSGGFQFVEYAEIGFPEWKEMSERGEKEPAPEYADNFVESNVRLVIWRVTERLIANKAFEKLNMSSPFFVGYGIHEQEEVTLRILNWPTL